MERLCKDCKHYTQAARWPGPIMACHALDRDVHPVYGGAIDGIEAGIVRLTLCGWKDPKFWEPKPKETP